MSFLEEEYKIRHKLCTELMSDNDYYTLLRQLRAIQRKRLGFTEELHDAGGGRIGWYNPKTKETIYI